MSLALSTLIYEWRRYMAAVIALALSGLLILATVGMFIGLGKAFSASIDRARAEIMILSPDARNIDSMNPLPERIRPAIFMHPEVVDVTPLAMTGGTWMNKPGPGEDLKIMGASLLGIDTYAGAPSIPTDYPDAVRIALQQPFSVAIDETAQGAFGVQVGDTATINGRAVKVVTLITGYPNIMDQQVVMSRDTMRMLGLRYDNGTVGSLMATIRDPLRAEQVRDELNAVAAGRYRAWTREDLAKANSTFIFEEAIIGIMLGFFVFLGIAIGVGVTSMTLRGAILANIKELASLRALGVSMGSLRLLVLELAFWVGAVGILTTFILLMGVNELAAMAGLIMAYPAFAVIGVSALLIVIAMLSGVFSLGLLKKSQPADLLR